MPKINPCPACEGKGQNASRETLETLVRLLLLAGASTFKPRRSVHPFLYGIGISSTEQLGTTLHEITTGLAGREPHPGIGHDAIDAFSAVRAIIQAAGHAPDAWGICGKCNGTGQVPEPKKS
jgi:hypothetical protein